MMAKTFYAFVAAASAVWSTKRFLGEHTDLPTQAWAPG